MDNELKNPRFLQTYVNLVSGCGAILYLWHRYLCQSNRDSRGVRKQCLWNNVAICIDKQPLNPWTLIAPRVNHVDNLVDGNETLMTYEAFIQFQKYPESRIKRLGYMGLCYAISKQWKVLLQGSDCLTEEETCRSATITIKCKAVPLRLIKCKYFYERWRNSVAPPAQQSWGDEGFGFGDYWTTVYSLFYYILLLAYFYYIINKATKSQIPYIA